MWLYPLHPVPHGTGSLWNDRERIALGEKQVVPPWILFGAGEADPLQFVFRVRSGR